MMLLRRININAHSARGSLRNHVQWVDTSHKFIKKKELVKRTQLFDFIEFQLKKVMGNIVDESQEEQEEGQEETFKEKKKKHEGIPIFDEKLQENLYTNMDQAPPRSYGKKINFFPILLPQVQRVVKELKADPINKQRRGFQFPPFHLIKKKAFYFGDWENGLPHGYGKIVLNNGSYYEGMFFEGQLQGSDGILVFIDGSYKRGAFKESKMDGKGCFVNAQGTFKYEGEWVHNKPHGQGIETYQDGSEFSGRFKEGVKHGTHCTFTWSNGKVYKGPFVDGYMEGEGVLKMETGKGKGQFKGIFQKGMKVSGTLVTQKGTYTGPFKDGLMQGDGQFKWDDGKQYIGQFHRNKLWGKGKMIFPQGSVVEGEWQKGKNIKITGFNQEEKVEVKKKQKTKKTTKK